MFSVWVGTVPLINETSKLLNHQYYCQKNNYDYKHFYINKTIFFEKYPHLPEPWYTVNVMNEYLLTSNYSDYTYFIKLDIDNQFARLDLRLETIIDPEQKYHLYLTEIDYSRFTQAHVWIFKNSDFTRAFFHEWLDYSKMGNCRDIAGEQVSNDYLNLFVNVLIVYVLFRDQCI